MTCKEYIEKKKAAEATGLKYCGACKVELEPGDFAGTSARCKVCVASPRPSKYRAPRDRQSLSDLCPAPSRAEVLATVQARHDQTAAVIESHARLVAREETAKQSAEAALAGFRELQAPFKAPSVHAGGLTPFRVTDTSERHAAPPWATEDAEVQKRLEALRKQLNGEI